MKKLFNQVIKTLDIHRQMKLDNTHFAFYVDVGADQDGAWSWLHHDHWRLPGPWRVAPVPVNSDFYVNYFLLFYY